MAVPKMSLDPAKRELGDSPIIVSKYSAIMPIYVYLQKCFAYKHTQNSIFHYAFSVSLCPPFVLIFCLVSNLYFYLQTFKLTEYI